MSEEKEFKVVVHGFKTKKQAEAFMHWYSGAGEQDADHWFENHGFSAMTNDNKTFKYGEEIKEENGELNLFLNVTENEDFEDDEEEND